MKTRNFVVGGGAGIVFKRTSAHPAAKIRRSEKEKMKKYLETEELWSITFTSQQANHPLLRTGKGPGSNNQQDLFPYRSSQILGAFCPNQF
jgi:hypothetical protein